MKKLLLICLTLLLGVSGSASADIGKFPAKWTKLPVDTGSNLGTSYYRVHRIKGDRIKMWMLYDNKTATYTITGKYLSAKWLSEYDCKEDQVKINRIITFSKNMGEGWVVSDSDTYNSTFAWVGSLPHSPTSNEMKFACKLLLLNK